MMPALLTTTPILPWACSASSNRRATPAASASLHGDGAPARPGDLLDHLGGLVAIAGIIDDDGKTVARQPQSRGAADAARGAGHDRMLRRKGGRNVIHPNFSYSRRPPLDTRQA